MSKFAIEAELRESRGKEKNKKTRRAGRLPVIAYGIGEPDALSIDAHEFDLLLQHIAGEKVIVDLNYAGKSEKVFIRDVQRDPVSDKPLHVDFFRVDMNKELHTILQVHQVGTPIGLKEGGILEHGLREVHVKATPSNLPPHIEVDVSELHLNQAIHIGDLPAIEGLQFLTNEDSVVFSVVSKQRAEEETTETEGAEGEEAPAAASAES